MRVPGATILGALVFSSGCSSTVDSEWNRIDELEQRLGTVQSLESLEGAKARPAEPRIAGDMAEVDRVEGLLSLMSVGEPRDLTLVEVRRSTLENNLQIQSTLLLPEISDQRLRAERAKFQSTFVASIEQSRVVSPDYGVGPQLDSATTSFTAVPGLEIPLQSGGSVSLDWTLATSEISGPGSADVASSLPSVRLQQPLLRGAGVEYNEGSIIIAGAELGVARSEAQVEVINQLVRAEVAYWQLHLAWRLLEIDLDLYTTARTLLDEQRRLVAVGAGSIANVYNFETLLANAVDGVVQAEQQVRQAVRAVKVVMQEPAMTLDGSVALRPVSEPRLVGFDFNAQRLVNSALENRGELLQLEFEQLARVVEVSLAKNQTLPQLDLRASWNASGYDRSLSIAAATSNLLDGRDSPGWSIGAVASIPIGNEIALANYQAAILQRLQTIADRRQQEILVTQEVLDAIDAIEAGWNGILTVELQVRAATRFYQSYQTLFSRGQIPSSNLTQALQTLNAAKIQKVSAEVEYQISLAQLAAATGCLLGHAGVDWTSDLDIDRLERPGETPLEGIPAGDGDALEQGRPTLQQMLDRAVQARTDGSDGAQDSSPPSTPPDQVGSGSEAPDPTPPDAEPNAGNRTPATP